MIRIIALVLCLAFTSMSFGVDENGDYMVRGLANHSCGKFTSAVDKGNNAEKWEEWNKYQNHTLGFINGLNLGLGNTTDLLGNTDMSGAMAFLEKHCRENPLDKYRNAIDALLLELYPNRTITAP